jgi:hypothetical protein
MNRATKSTMLLTKESQLKKYIKYRATVEEQELVKNMAKKKSLTISDYLRSLVKQDSINNSTL